MSDASPTSVADASTLLGFGKHREKTLAEASALPELVDWALGIGAPKGKLDVFVQFLKANGAEKKPKEPKPPAEDDEEEELPLAEKLAAKRKMGSSSSKAPAASSSKAPAAAADDDDSEEDVPLAQRKKKAASPPKKKAKKAKAEAEEDDDNDDDASEGSDDESEEDDPSDKGLLNMAKRMAAQVILLGGKGDEEGVLSVLGVEITRDTPYEEQRKAYRGLARLLHPDKLGRSLGKDTATKAFQYLTSAFEALSTPDPLGGKKSKKPAGPSVGRSNDGCYRTPIGCPRCFSKWGTAESGLQPYEYTFMMQGLKTYVCGGCLLRFGCMTAIHQCPGCNKGPLPYHPKRYHDKKTCMSCKLTYGYKLYTTGPRIEAQLKEQIIEQAAKRQNTCDGEKARLERMKKRPATTYNNPEEYRAQQELLFKMCLIDECPRCGEAFLRDKIDPEHKEREGEKAFKDREKHLRGCDCKKDHEKYAKKVEERQEKRSREATGLAKQDEVGQYAKWQFLGGNIEMAWMLTDEQLKSECEKKGLAIEGGRVQQLARLKNHEGDEGGGSSSGGAGSSVPQQLHALSMDALKAVAAAHGVVLPEKASKDEVIDLLEARKGALPAIVLKDGEKKKEDGEEGAEDDKESEGGDGEWKGGEEDEDSDEEGEEEVDGCV